MVPIRITFAGSSTRSCRLLPLWAGRPAPRGSTRGRSRSRVVESGALNRDINAG